MQAVTTYLMGRDYHFIGGNKNNAENAVLDLK